MDKISFRVYPYYSGNDESAKSTPFEDDWELDEHGIPFISGQTDVNEMIQSYEKECDINTIIAQHLALGTIGELACESTDDLVDVSNLPDDLNSKNELAGRAKKIYDSLTSEQKALFTGYDDFIVNFDKLFKVNENNDDEVNNNE